MMRLVMRTLWWLLAMVVWLGVGVPAARAQSQPSLADVARQEAERRKAVKAPTKVYTNDDVKKMAPATLTTAARTQKPESAAASTDAEAGPADASGERAADEPAKDEAYWRKRMTDATEQLQRSRLFAEALQSRINGLTTDFVNRDDPAQREVVARQREEALAELDRVNREIAALTKSIADIEDEARRASVPPGWLR
jgi:hypothetical protein